MDTRIRPQTKSNFTPRVIAVILILLFIFLAWTFFWLLMAERNSLRDQRKLGLGDNADLAVSLFQQLDRQVADGNLTRQQAIDHAIRMLRGMRYGDNSGYFYLIDTSGTMVMHPLKPELEGEDILGLKDAKGNEFIRDIVGKSATEPDGIGYAQFYKFWVGDDGSAPLCIAAYSRYEPWNWIVVTQAMVSDLDNQITRHLGQQVLILFVLSVILAFVLSTTLKRLVLSGVDRLIEVARKLQAGDLTARISTNPTDEMVALSSAFNDMADGIQERDGKIRLAQRAAVFALAKLAEARDRETGGHLLRVREYTAALANALRKRNGWAQTITQEYIQELYDATMLHDIGKVAIPDSILLKPDVLDDGERAIMMSHTLVGANTIRMARERMEVESTFLEMAEQIARSHHERWDGNGYVECLKGEDIPLPARIFTVADIYDALTTRRAYKKAYSHEEAVTEMSFDRAKRFDPVVFDTFLEIGEEFDRIRRDYADE